MSYKKWCKDMMRSLTPGKKWVIPRTKLVFERQGDALVLIGRTAHTQDPSGPMHPAQRAEYAMIEKNFRAAGFEVRNQLEESDEIVAIRATKARVH